RVTGVLMMPVLMVFFASVASGQPVAGKKATFQILKYNNPGAVADLGVGLWAWPIPTDYDGDGDMDLVVSCNDEPFNGIWFFENRSGEKIPVFEPPERVGDALRDVQVSYTDGQTRVLIPGRELKNFRKGSTPE